MMPATRRAFRYPRRRFLLVVRRDNLSKSQGAEPCDVLQSRWAAFPFLGHQPALIENYLMVI
jgi:hypothetical protein